MPSPSDQSRTVSGPLVAADPESALGLIAAARTTLDAASHPQRAKLFDEGPIVGVKVREVLADWPPDTWQADDGKSDALTGDAGKLRLLWFSAPDADGWFSLAATDSNGASWSTYCRTTESAWLALERALGASLKQPLELVGNVELDAALKPRLR